MLILDIFAQHAKSRDGKLQVELAQLRYALPRLDEKNTMMSRLTGGIGGRGPGETKLEINRRRARERIHLPRAASSSSSPAARRLRAPQRTRREPADRRDRRLHQRRQVDAAERAHRGRRARRGQAVRDARSDRRAGCASRASARSIITDTVGFIRDLPRDLAPAFRATLEEMDDADLLLHVVDAADPDRDEQIAAVERILADLGLGEKPRLVVLNKMDLVPPDQREAVMGAEAGPGAIAVSARDRHTTGPLLAAVELALWREGRLERRDQITSVA